MKLYPGSFVEIVNLPPFQGWRGKITAIHDDGVKVDFSESGIDQVYKESKYILFSQNNINVLETV